MLRQVKSSADQLCIAAQTAAEVDLSQIPSRIHPRAIVVTGMGGSGVAGEVLSVVCGPGSATQVVALHDYQLPGWVGVPDLVIAVSCSGATEETLSSAREAVRRGCPLIGVGSAGSPLALLAEQAGAPFVPVKSTGNPRSTFWGLSVPLLVIAERLGVAEIPGAAELEATAVELERISQLCRPDSESVVNPAKTLALELAGKLPMIWSTSPLTSVAAARFATQLHENADYPAMPGMLPEVYDGQAGVFEGPFARRPASDAAVRDREDPSPSVPLHLVILRDSQERPRVTHIRKAFTELAEQRGIGVTDLMANGETTLQRLASLIQLIDYASVYLGIAIGIDPSQATVISELKERIA
jgi:glucose/mannose-6-phosphate isomerase